MHGHGCIEVGLGGGRASGARGHCDVAALDESAERRGTALLESARPVDHTQAVGQRMEADAEAGQAEDAPIVEQAPRVFG
jgi:hypothetical protein